jgi:hypothetical protein
MNSDNFKQNFINAVLGKLTNNTKYSPAIEEYLNTFSDAKQRQDVANGLNGGSKDILAKQIELGINRPDVNNQEQLDLARAGKFNLPTEGGVRQGGLINGYNQGYNLNYDNPTDQISTRIGQALGTIKRGADSPLGRAIIAYGASRALNVDNPTEQALKAALTRSNNQAANQYYRKQLSDMGFDLSDTNYEINQDIFQNILKGQTLKDNAEFKRMFYDNQQKQNEALMALKQQQLALEKEKERSDNEWRQKELDFKYYDSDNKNNKESNKEDNKIQDLNELEEQLDAFENMFNKVPNKLRGQTEGALRQKLGLTSVNEANFNAQRTLLYNQIARKLGGEKGVLSDQDIKRIEASLPSLTDSYAQRKAKMKAIRNLLQIKVNSAKNETPSNKSNRVNRNDLYNKFKKAGYTEEEINEYFARRGIG